MKYIKSESITEFAHLKAPDQKEFFDLISDYFYERAEHYRGHHTIFLFASDNGVFEITSKFSFDCIKKFENFRKSIGEQDYYFDLSAVSDELHFNFTGDDYSSFENFNANFGELGDYLDSKGEVKTTPPKNFWEVLIRKVIKQYVTDSKSKKANLAS